MSVVNEMLNDLQKNQHKSVGFDYFDPQDKKTFISNKTIIFVIVFIAVAILIGFNYLTINNIPKPTQIKVQTSSSPTNPIKKVDQNVSEVAATISKQVVEVDNVVSKKELKTKEIEITKTIQHTTSTIPIPTTTNPKLLTSGSKVELTQKLPKKIRPIKIISRKNQSRKLLASIIKQWNQTSTNSNVSELKELLYLYSDLPDLWLHALIFLNGNRQLIQTGLYHQLLTQSLENFPNKKLFLILSAKNYFGIGSYIKTLQQLHKIPSIDWDQNTHQLAGLTFQKQGKHQQAISEYKKLLAINPTRGDINMAVGISHEALMQPKKAISHFTLALKDKKLNQLQKQFIGQRLVAHHG